MTGELPEPEQRPGQTRDRRRVTGACRKVPCRPKVVVRRLQPIEGQGTIRTMKFVCGRLSDFEKMRCMLAANGVELPGVFELCQCELANRLL